MASRLLLLHLKRGEYRIKADRNAAIPFEVIPIV